ncbi:murein biosynthesis integral membrane protein MurJ [Tessaracoccus flavus]|uniref:murein biosynthesis integral membrane protein MurJ n=1 Tax=Tessaracoccus flavus TaxID=1610493 RepID=UPI00089515EF|nr:murein biosynthesis integral membrane protein MurJ [Tessaracoccus flavus]SDY76755.1 putative peptidoglycan lipid II flippase [Tessaracoccus flavus]
MSQVSSTRRLVSASAIMASGTLISRALGVGRVMLLAFILGNGTRQADMYGLATMVPNSLYILFAGGALNTVLVPQIVRAIKNDDDGGEAYTNRIMTAFMLIVASVAVLVTVAAPVVTAIYSSGEWREPALTQQYASMVALTYLTLPQIFFYGAFFLLGQVLNARDKFGPMMWAPIANNVISILVLSTYLIVWGNDENHSAAFSTPQILLLGIGSTLGIAVQMAVLLPFVKKVGFKIRPRFDLKGTGLGKTFSLTKWTMGFVAVNQLALVVVNRLATSATATGSGSGVVVYANAHLVWILPHSLITVSLATAMLPSASRLAASGDDEGVAAEFTKTVRLALIVIVPATVGFLALAGPIATLLFGNGQGAADAAWVAWALMAFAVGLIPFTIQFVCLRTFYALENTRTPFFLQCLIAGLNIVGAISLVWLVDSPNWVAAALALAYSVAYLVGVFFSWRALRRSIPGLDGHSLLMHLVRLLLGTVVGGVAAYYLSGYLISAIDNRVLANLVSILAGLTLIAAFYVVIGKLLKVRELSSLGQLVRTRLGRRSGGPAAETSTDLTPSTMAASSREELLVRDQAPTRVSPMVDDPGPATVIRNRPAVTEHTFGQTSRAVAVDDDADDDDDQTDEPSGGGWDDPSPAYDGGDDDTTGPIDMAGIFREEPRGRVASVGTLLNTRYELVQSLADRHGTETWRAHDSVLSRDVVVHVIAPGDPRIPELMLAARKGAAATDSRFLRVLDADELGHDQGPIGAYVVAEYAAGRSLTDLLARGPLSTLEAAHIVRELADALVPVHAQGLFHEQLNPDNVIITNTGAVRLAGFGVEAALAGRDDQTWASRERADVVGLGNLLYAALVRHWPGGHAYGLPAAPVVAGEPASPHTVLGGISPALDRICSSTITQRGSLSDRRITSASDMAGALSAILGTADASLDLETRVRTWQRDSAAQSWPDDDLGGTGPLAALMVDDDEDDLGIIPARRAHSTQVMPAAPPESQPGPRTGLLLLIGLAIATLVISLILVGTNNASDNAATEAPTTPGAVSAEPSPEGSTSESPGPPAGAPTVVSARDFDPEADGGNAEENPGSVANAVDGDPATSWSTLQYHNRPELGGLKPGVGVILDLGEERSVTEAELILTGGATSVELRVPTGDTASERSEADWEVVAADDEATGTVVLAPEAPVTTRYLLVYFTRLPEVSDSRYLAELNEVTIR